VLLTAANFGTYGHLIRMLAYTGQRLGQILALTERHIDKESKTLSWSAFEMKGHQAHSVPYGPLTASLLEEMIELRFYRNLDPHGAFVEACGIPHFTRHDLRRTFSTIHAQIGTPPHITERLLAHKNGAASGGMIGMTYNRYRYEKECREACTAFDETLAGLVARA
jgi:integrase